MALFRRLLPALLALAPTAPALAIDESDLLPIDQAFVLTAEAISADRIELTWQIADGYYLYRHRMGAESMTPAFGAIQLDLPPGKVKIDEFFGEVQTYRHQVNARVLGTPSAGLAELSLKVRYQGCADIGVCYPPHSKVLQVSLPATSASVAPLALPGSPGVLPLGATSGGLSLLGAKPGGATQDSLPLPEEQAFAFEAISVDHGQLLLRLTPAPGYYLYRDRSRFEIADSSAVELGTPAWPPAERHTDEHFGDVAVYFQQVEIPLPVRRLSADAVEFTLHATLQGCQTDGICYPPMQRQVRLTLPALPAGELPATASSSGPALGLAATLLALIGALLGGLVLNLMPCVLPVLSLKALSLADSHGHAQARRSALWYTAGVLVSFAALGLAALSLRATGAALGWGFQLQQPWVVGLLAYVMFAVGLSLSGVFEVGARLAGMGQALTERKGAAGDFFTGVLAVVVASPCTAPFMGPALAFAFAAPAWLALAVFLALGLGLALPFLLIGFIPALAARLPRPGAWMVALKQVLAYPMYLTAVWLAWVLAKQRGADAIGLLLVGAVLLAAGLWGFERQRWRPRLLGVGASALVLALALGALPMIQSLPRPGTASADDAGSVAYSVERLDTLRADGRTVFVNMTADWCVTCKANEARLFATDDFRNAMTAVDAVYMKGDWTNVDPQITAFLEAHGAVGVPLYVVFRPGRATGEVLPTVPGLEALINALSAPPSAP